MAKKTAVASKKTSAAPKKTIVEPKKKPAAAKPNGKNLLIVESPAKAKTIEKFLDDKFIVRSSYGHIRDLPKNDKAIDIKNNFKPEYVISEDKKDVVNELKKLAGQSKEVWLATDKDREGEAIAWHLCEALGLDSKTTKRIVFHEITKSAITEAVENPRIINKELVDAQQARRVLDRLVGFKLSPILWRKISRAQNNLSAGRVQSVAVRIIVEREREINAFASSSSYKIAALFNAKDKNNAAVTFKAELPQNKSSEEEAIKFLTTCIGSAFTVKDVQTKPGKKSPTAPFTTSTLQQEASRKFGFSVSRTMSIAQRLYESGRITYMRTDSTNLSETAITSISKEIVSSYGDNYLQNRKYSTKTANAQEAHEAIRPSYIDVREIDGEADEQKLYGLIWRRTIASQMSDARLEKTIVRIGISKNQNEELTANGEVLLFDGFLKVYMESTDDEQDDANEGMLPPLKAGDDLKLKDITATERFSRPPARYNEASLVKKLEELGIGRPSTYAPTISTIQKRGYVEKASRDGVKRKYNACYIDKATVKTKVEEENTGVEKNKLFPTDIGMMVNDFLVEHFNSIVDFGFTAEIEKEFDDISNGDITWEKMIKTFYGPFSKNVEKTLETAERVTGERSLGVDPKSGKPVIVRMARYGPIVQIGTGGEEDEKPRMAGLRPGMTLETVSLEDALKLFDLPRKVGQYEDKDVTVSTGRFGPYVLYNAKFISLKKEQDPYTISLEDAITLIKEKQNSVIKEWKEQGVSVLIGRWGPYVKSGRLNAKIPKDVKPEDLSLEDSLELLEAAKAAPRTGRFKRRSG